ncbi:hypothetical protein LPJ61_005149, partial [Coemansia biformis]
PDAGAGGEQKPVLGNAPFIFRMPAVPEKPAAGSSDPTAATAMDWEMPREATRSTDNNPISPNAARKIAARRNQEAMAAAGSQHASRDDVFSRIQESPMVGDRRFNRRQQQQQQKLRRRNRLRRRDDPTSSWITDSESSKASSDGGFSDTSVVSRARTVDSCGSRSSSRAASARRGATPGSWRRQGDAAGTPGSMTRRGGRGKRSARSRREWRVSEGVDRVLALMGTRVEEPTMVERLQMHRDIPYVISGYLQLGFNVFMVGTVLMIVVNVLLTIQRDVNAKVQAYSAEILQEISSCSKQYLDNRCDPLLRVPAMEQACRAWENCMHRDPTRVGRARVSAETLAEIVNGFIEPISLKTMLFFVLMFVGTLFVSNFAFGAYRHSRVHHQNVIQSGGGGGGGRQDIVDGSTGSAMRFSQQQQQQRIVQRQNQHYRNDDPLASPSPRPPGTAQMLVPMSPSSSAAASTRPVHRTPSGARRDRSAHSVDRRCAPHR